MTESEARRLSEAMGWEYGKIEREWYEDLISLIVGEHKCIDQDGKLTPHGACQVFKWLLTQNYSIDVRHSDGFTLELDSSTVIDNEFEAAVAKAALSKLEQAEMSEPVTHALKTWPYYFVPVLHGIKTFEIRKNDRDFKEGDQLLLREWDPRSEDYTGRECVRWITYIFHGGVIALEADEVAMSISPYPPAPSEYA